MLTMIMVSDMERSVRFYRHVLGLKLKFQSPDWTEFSVDSTTLALHGGAKPQPAPAREQFAGTASIGFNVANLDSTCEDLKRKGARMVLPPTEREVEGIRLVVFLDPDGLSVSCSQNVGR